MTVGLLTYHSAYNYGSVLQAYATQESMIKLGYQPEIINYRMKEQRRFYRLYRPYYGARTFAKDVMQLPVHRKRKARCAAFEMFFQKYLHLSEECHTPSDVYSVWRKYPVIVSGSDQIWNKHSQELEHNGWEYMRPYLLHGYAGRKISYASSIGNMTDEELQVVKQDIMDFDFVSMRETTSAMIIREQYNRDVETVVDPTFLLSSQEWVDKLQLTRDSHDKYILFYGLLGIQPLKEMAAILRPIAAARHCKLRIITPFAYLNLNDAVIEMHPEYGPKEFLNVLYNAECVYTSSYHGTILAVNLNKDVYSICEKAGTEFRKTDILNRLGLGSRIIYDTLTLSSQAFSPIDYTSVNAIIDDLRKQSLVFLGHALTETILQEDFHE